MLANTPNPKVYLSIWRFVKNWHGYRIYSERDAGCLILSPPLKTSITRRHTNSLSRAAQAVQQTYCDANKPEAKDMTKLNVAVRQDAVIVDAAAPKALEPSLTAGLSRATLSRISRRSLKIEMPEQKQLSQMIVLDEDLSEFERARRTSKTWSMGQD